MKPIAYLIVAFVGWWLLAGQYHDPATGEPIGTVEGLTGLVGHVVGGHDHHSSDQELCQLVDTGQIVPCESIPTVDPKDPNQIAREGSSR